MSDEPTGSDFTLANAGLTSAPTKPQVSRTRNLRRRP